MFILSQSISVPNILISESLMEYLKTLNCFNQIMNIKSSRVFSKVPFIIPPIALGMLIGSECFVGKSIIFEESHSFNSLF